MSPLPKSTIVLTVVCLLLTSVGRIQAQEVADSADFHVRVSTGIGAATGFGSMQAVSWVAPSFEIYPTDRLTVRAGFANMGSLMPTGYSLKGYGPRDLAPRRTGTQATAVWAMAEYQVNNRLCLWGAVAHLGGFSQPLWLDHSLPLHATAVSGGFGWKVTDHSLLEMHFTYVHDTYGTAFGPMYGHHWDPLAPSYTLFESPWSY